MFKKTILWSFLLLIISELLLNLYYFSTRFRPQQNRLNLTISKIDDTDPSRSIYCIGDGFTSGFGSKNNKSYPSYLQSLIDSNIKYKGLKVVNLGSKDSTIYDHLQIIAKLRPNSRVILRSNLDHILYSKAHNSNPLESLQIVKWTRSLLSYPAMSKKSVERLYYIKTTQLIKQRQHEVIYFNYTHIDTFMNHFNLDSFLIGREMKEKQNKYSYTSVSKKYISSKPPFLNDLGYSMEADLLFKHIVKQGLFLQAH